MEHNLYFWKVGDVYLLLNFFFKCMQDQPWLIKKGNLTWNGDVTQCACFYYHSENKLCEIRWVWNIKLLYSDGSLEMIEVFLSFSFSVYKMAWNGNVYNYINTMLIAQCWETSLLLLISPQYQQGFYVFTHWDVTFFLFKVKQITGPVPIKLVQVFICLQFFTNTMVCNN